MANWRAVQCQTMREAVARDNLEELGITCFYPWRKVRHWRHRRSVWLRRAYFPGYLFADLEGFGPLGTVIGVERILGETAIPEPVIVRIKELADSEGQIREPLLKPGDSIPIGNLMAEIEHLDERVARVLIPIFGHLWTASLPASRLLSIS